MCAVGEVGDGPAGVDEDLVVVGVDEADEGGDRGGDLQVDRQRV